MLGFTELKERFSESFELVVRHFGLRADQSDWSAMPVENETSKKKTYLKVQYLEYVYLCVLLVSYQSTIGPCV